MTLKHFYHSYWYIFLIIVFTNIYTPSQEKDTSTVINNLDTSEFKITLSFDKPSYFEGEEIFINVAIANLTNYNDSLPGLSVGAINEYITVEDRGGAKLKSRKIGVIDARPPVINFKPGETIIYEVEESLNFGNAETDISEYKSSHGIIRYFEAGYYSFQMRFNNDYSNRTILSNKAYLLVSTPMGHESSHFEKLLAIDNMSDIKDKAIHKKIDSYANFLKKYPSSVYYDQTFFMYINFRQEANVSYNDSIIVDISKYVSKKPNSIYSEKLLINLYDAIVRFGGSRDKAINTMYNLISVHRGTRVSKRALEILAQKE